MNFSENFIWGAASSAYQIEGAAEEEGKGPSIWDMFTRNPAHVWQGHNGKVASDHYHRYQEDVDLMANIGIKAYRFSISWPRILPHGDGRTNAKGIDFYDRLVDELLAKKIDPWVTLFHWDYPYDLFLRGGWLNSESPEWFSKYTTILVNRLSDRVSNWMTLNEPQGFIGLGHHLGEHAPGLRLDLPEVLLAGHHSLLAHGRAVEIIRTKAKTKPTVGWSSAGAVYYPATNSPEDIRAARQATLAVYPNSVWNNRWWADPVVFGNYPEEGLRVYGKAVPRFTKAEMKLIKQPLDFFGSNIFSGPPVKAEADGNAVLSPLAPGHPHTHYLWPITPEAMYWGPRFLTDHYKLPIVITENGLSTCDTIGLDDKVHDNGRIEFMSTYLLQLRRALRDGIDIRGYFAWSIMDNFEWQEGFKHRFGLVHVDFETQKRTLKDSALWYREVISSNGGGFDKFISGGGTTPPYVVKETMRYANAHLHESFNIKDLANHLRCHPDFLSRKFKKITGVDLSLYLRRIRIDHAMELLKNPETSIDDAADKSGFTDRIHFTKVFRRLTGQTPGQFQRQFRTSETRPQIFAALLKPENPRSNST